MEDLVKEKCSKYIAQICDQAACCCNLFLLSRPNKFMMNTSEESPPDGVEAKRVPGQKGISLI
jgi:hypothetical protein